MTNEINVGMTHSVWETKTEVVMYDISSSDGGGGW